MIGSLSSETRNQSTRTLFDAAEQVRAAHHLLASVDLATLLRDREEVFSRLPALALSQFASWGVVLVDVDLLVAAPVRGACG
jgi:hypothetical protein